MPIRDIPDLERRLRRLEMEADQRRHKIVVPERAVNATLPIREGGTSWQTFDGITITGWNTSLSYTAQLEYTTVGNLVFCRLHVGGASNSTQVIVTLPFAAKSGLATAAFRGEITSANNDGTLLTAPGHWAITQGSNNLFAYTSMPAGAWTASGIKSINISFWYVKE